MSSSTHGTGTHGTGTHGAGTHGAGRKPAGPAVLVGAWVAAVAGFGWFVAATLAEVYAAEEALRAVAWTGWQTAALAVAVVLGALAVTVTVRAVRRA